MSATKWTPGPWRMIQPVALDYRAPLVYGANQESLVAYIEGGGPRRAVTGAEVRANAFLIAAAPELYEALVAAEEELRLLRMKDTAAIYNPVLRTQISLALTKARGES